MILNINKSVTKLSEDTHFAFHRIRLFNDDSLDHFGCSKLANDMRDLIRDFQSIIAQLDNVKE